MANVHVSVDESDGDVTFLRTVEEGATNRSYGVHVADLAGVPDPVVRRAGDVLDRLRAEKAIEAKGSESGGGEPVQAVFDLGSGKFQGAASADGGTGTTEEDASPPALDPETAAVMGELRETDLTATSPIDLVATVQE